MRRSSPSWSSPRSSTQYFSCRCSGSCMGSPATAISWGTTAQVAAWPADTWSPSPSSPCASWLSALCPFGPDQSTPGNPARRQSTPSAPVRGPPRLRAPHSRDRLVPLPSRSDVSAPQPHGPQCQATWCGDSPSTARHDPGVGSRTGKDYSVGSTRARHNAQDATSRSYPFWKTTTVQGEQRLVARLLSVQLAVLARGPGLRMGSENLDRPGPSLRGEGPGLSTAPGSRTDPRSWRIPAAAEHCGLARFVVLSRSLLAAARMQRAS